MNNNINNLKLCRKCKNKYPATSSYYHNHKNRSDGLDPWCKECKKKYHKSYYKLKKYNISKQDFENLLREQENRCAICGLKFEEIFSNYKYPYNYDPDIDHDHKRGKIRGLLCLNCNRALGRCKENKLILLKAVEYLNRNKDRMDLI